MSIAETSYQFDGYPDLRLEFILGELVESGLDPDEIVINTLGIFRRRYGRDLAGSEIREYRTNKRKFVNLFVNRNGIYDLLPKGLFHQPQNRINNISPAQAIEEYKMQKQIEQDSRLFFLPFEQELYRLLLLLESEERNSIFDIRNIFRSEEFINFWNIPDFFNGRRICTLLYVLPLAGSIAGNIVLTKLTLECILNDRVDIIESPPQNHMVPEAGFAELNEVYLGVSFVIGENFREVSDSIDVYIHPTGADDIISYLEGGQKQKMLQFMLDYFIPFDCDVTTHIVSGEMFELDEAIHHSRLGITTSI